MTGKDCRGTCGATKAKTVVCLLLWMSVHQISCLYTPQEMKSAIHLIQEYYKISNDDIYNNQPVISRELLTSNNTEKKMLYMVAVLETYERLIGRMLEQLPTPSPAIAGSKQSPTDSGSAGSPGSEAVRQKLKGILEKVQHLKKKFYQEQTKLLHRLQDLNHIQVNNVKVQYKALVELQFLYDKASSLPNTALRRRRRRRQAKNKTHLRG